MGELNTDFIVMDVTPRISKTIHKTAPNINNIRHTLGRVLILRRLFIIIFTAF